MNDSTMRKMLAVLGQVVHHYLHWYTDDRISGQYTGFTAYGMAKLINVSAPTATKYLLMLEEFEFVEVEWKPHRNTTQKRVFFLTSKGRQAWHNLDLSMRREAQAWVAKNHGLQHLIAVDELDSKSLLTVESVYKLWSKKNG